MMTRWRPKHNKEQVLELFARMKKENPRVSSTAISKELDCHPAYVRATLARAGIILPRSKRKTPSFCGINPNKKLPKFVTKKR